MLWRMPLILCMPHSSQTIDAHKVQYFQCDIQYDLLTSHCHCINTRLPSLLIFPNACVLQCVFTFFFFFFFYSYITILCCYRMCFWLPFSVVDGKNGESSETKKQSLIELR